jgi:probable rRNA maturation factor
MPVVISSRLRSRRLRLSSVRSLAGKVLRAVGAARADLSLLLVGDRSMRRLNRLYRRKDRTTDVLAFPMRVTRHPSRVTPDLLGDIVISLPQAERQAAQAGHALEREMAALLIHGLLHLLGYDHERSAREARRMQRKERAVLRALKN